MFHSFYKYFSRVGYYPVVFRLLSTLPSLQSESKWNAQLAVWLCHHSKGVFGAYRPLWRWFPHCHQPPHPPLITPHSNSTIGAGITAPAGTRHFPFILYPHFFLIMLILVDFHQKKLLESSRNIIREKLT